MKKSEFITVKEACAITYLKKYGRDDQDYSFQFLYLARNEPKKWATTPSKGYLELLEACSARMNEKRKDRRFVEKNLERMEQELKDPLFRDYTSRAMIRAYRKEFLAKSQ
jgi:hypothetical protein